MKGSARRLASPFDVVKTIGLTLPGVEAATRYDGSPVLKAGGVFMAAIASHPTAEPASLVVRYSLEERDYLLDEAPETYYVTDSYRQHPVVLARLSQIGEDALRDLLTVSWRMAMAKARPRRAIRRTTQSRRRSVATRPAHKKS